MVRIRDIHYKTLILETDTYDKAKQFIDDEGYAIIKEDVDSSNDFIIWIG